ncbi:MAG TPA: bestrophin family ion channel [Polyangia bacterium]|jgi:putative membrane protein|nr:bestrophin family ion channel [Polyangia bacterium]
MIDYDAHRWWPHLFDIRGSMVRQIGYRVLATVVWSAAIVAIDQTYHDIDMPPTVHSLLGVALGLLLVFRTNASYDRFWEGRRMWGGMVNETRNLARLGHSLLSEAPGLYQELVQWTIAFAYASMHHLRGQKSFGPMVERLPREALERAIALGNAPLGASLEMTRRITQARQQGLISDVQQDMLDRNVQLLVDYLGACERINKTPLPFAYVVHLRRALLLYCLSLPSALVTSFGWWTVPANLFVSYTFYGIEEIGVQIEDPFGTDDNDLPLERICAGIDTTLSAFLTLGPLG